MPTQAMRCLGAAIVWLLTSAAAPHAAAAEAALEQVLSGGSSRAWVLHEIVRPPIAGTECVSGAIYTFTVSHDMQVTRCQAGHLATSRHTWAIQKEGSATTLVVTGIGTYAVTLQDAGPGPRRLRFHALVAAPGWPAGDEELHMDEN